MTLLLTAAVVLCAVLAAVRFRRRPGRVPPAPDVARKSAPQISWYRVTGAYPCVTTAPSAELADELSALDWGPDCVTAVQAPPQQR